MHGKDSFSYLLGVKRPQEESVLLFRSFSIDLVQDLFTIASTGSENVLKVVNNMVLELLIPCTPYTSVVFEFDNLVLFLSGSGKPVEKMSILVPENEPELFGLLPPVVLLLS